MKVLLIRAGLALVPSMLLFSANAAPPALGAEFTVNSTVEALDANPGDGICDDGSGACPFRAALMETNALPGADVILVPEGVFVGYVAVERPSTEQGPVPGDPIVTDGLSIIGAGSSASTIAWLHIDPFMAGISVSVSGLTVGYAGTGGRKISIGKTATASFEDVVVRGGSHGYGSGILNEGTAELRGVVIEDGTTYCRGAGAGIYNTGRMSLTDSVIRKNIADGHGGGGIYNAGGVMTLERVQIHSNYGGYVPGGGVHNVGDMTMNDVAIRENQGAFDAAGTGVYNGGTLILTNAEISGGGGNGSEGVAFSNSGEAKLVNVTVSGNQGGGIGNGSELGTAKMSIINSTITGNPIRPYVQGGGIWSTSGVVELRHSIVTGADHPACKGAITSLGHNIDSDGTCGLSAPGDMSGLDPRLGPLADNGGYAQTHSLLGGSPAIDGGGDCPPPETDQRGISRPRDGNGDGAAVCDIGAYELETPYSPETFSRADSLVRSQATQPAEVAASRPDARRPAALPHCKLGRAEQISR